MDLGYITRQDPNDPKAYSGIHYHMYQTLLNNFEDVFTYGPVDSKYKIVPKVEGRIRKLLSGKIYKYQYDIGLARRVSAIIDQKIRKSEPDILLASLMSPEVAFLKSKKPLFITTDATFPLLNELYQSHSNLHPKSIKNAKLLESIAFEKATKLILPLQWLADSAMNDYGISAKKIEVISYGSNLNYKLPADQLHPLIQSRLSSDKIVLLFVGVRWEEKGGPFAVEVLRQLLQMGVRAELEIMGCDPEIPDKPDEVKILGFLDKSKPEESRRVEELYREASFFIMPTKAECVGMSFIEAASVGLPAIGTEIGGVPEAITDNETGFIIGETHAPKETAEWIKKIWEDKLLYLSISENAFQRYTKKMNWELWGKKVWEIIEAAS